MCFVEVSSTSNMNRYRKLWCSRTKTLRCAPRFLVTARLLGPEARTFSTHIEGVFKKSTFDHEALLDVDSTSNLEFSRAFRCSRTKSVRCASQALASFNLLGAERRTF